MAKKLLASVMAFALCLFVSAADMVVKGKNGEDRKINVVDTSETFLRFKILSDSTVEVTITPSYRGHKSISIPEKVQIEGKVHTVTSIGVLAFAGCSSLNSINIPEGVTSIGVEAFGGCSSLTNIKIPEGVTSIGYKAFYGCDNLEPKLLIYDKGTKCYGWVGDKKKCTEVVIPEGVTSIGYSAFYKCSSLTSIKNPEGVTSIREEAFWGCYSLNSIKIPEGVTSIGYKAFYGCSSLTSIKIPESVTSIEERAFNGCSNLEIVIDNSKENVKVGDFAFDGCKSVKWLKN